MATITLKELGAQYKGIYSVKADTPRGRTEKAFEDLEAGDEVLIDNHFVEIVEDAPTYDKLIDEALEMLNNDDDLLIDVVNDLDSWNGYADGFRGYAMSDLNELFYGVLLTDFLDKLGRDFNHNDDFFIDTIYGIESTNDLAGHYRDNVDIGCLLDDFIEEYEANHVEVWGHDDFEEVIEAIIEAKQEANTDEE